MTFNCPIVSSWKDVTSNKRKVENEDDIDHPAKKLKGLFNDEFNSISNKYKVILRELLEKDEQYTKKHNEVLFLKELIKAYEENFVKKTWRYLHYKKRYLNLNQISGTKSIRVKNRKKR